MFHLLLHAQNQLHKLNLHPENCDCAETFCSHSFQDEGSSSVCVIGSKRDDSFQIELTESISRILGPFPLHSEHYGNRRGPCCFYSSHASSLAQQPMNTLMHGTEKTTFGGLCRGLRLLAPCPPAPPPPLNQHAAL